MKKIKVGIAKEINFQLKKKQKNIFIEDWHKL